MDTSTQKKAVRLFTIAICLIAVALGLSSANYANYFKEAYNVTSAQRASLKFRGRHREFSVPSSYRLWPVFPM